MNPLPDDLERARLFVARLQERTSTRVEPWRWGHALFRDDIPERYYSNYVRVERSLAGVEVAELVAETDVALAAFPHRQIAVADDHDGARIALGLAERGFEADHSAMLAHRRDPDRPSDVDAVEELSFLQARPFLLEVYRRELPDRDGSLADRFADFREVVQRAANGRFFARRVEGRLAGLCELYLTDGVAQVEHVDTLAEFRGRGIARSVVLRAVAEARQAAADLIVIEADLDDWPIRLYRRLGFEEIDRSWDFTRPATGSADQVSQE